MASAKYEQEEQAPDDAEKGKTLEEALDSFNRQIKVLSKDLITRFPSDATVSRAHKLTFLAIDTTPEFVINSVGPLLYRYQKQIDDKDEKFFLTSDYKDDFKKSKNKEKNAMVETIMEMLKKTWSSLKKDEKDAYFEVVIGLLGDFIDYKLACEHS